ncbi:MAG: hypothetical protein IPJ52_00850 [Rhodocyclaceae bacterium]|nr:hypothetical protein [Rhodocyclaceae bacterium]
MTTVTMRPAAVAGSFYPGNTRALSAAVGDMLADDADARGAGEGVDRAARRLPFIPDRWRPAPAALRKSAMAMTPRHAAWSSSPGASRLRPVWRPRRPTC